MDNVGLSNRSPRYSVGCVVNDLLIEVVGNGAQNVSKLIERTRAQRVSH
jgi:hypothetical protein